MGRKDIFENTRSGHHIELRIPAVVLRIMKKPSSGFSEDLSFLETDM